MKAKSILLVMIIMTLFVNVGLLAQVQMGIIPSSYSQNFDTLINSGNATWTDNSTLSNWYAQRTGTGTTIVAGTGSSNTGALYSFGSSGSTERALGSVGSGGAAAGHFAWGILLQNVTGSTISSITVSYTGEQWRDGGATTPAAQTASFYYQFSSSQITSLTPNNNTGWTAFSSLDFTSPTYTNTASGVALDGNAAANRTAISSVITLSLANNDYIMLKWEDPNHAGNDHGLSIDDITIEWDTNVPVVLSSFTATISADNYVTLTWISQSETGMAGYYLYRAETNQVSTAQIVSPLIPASNTSQPQTYTFTDSNLYNEGTYYYWLESRDLDGQNDFFGPVSVVYSTGGEYYTPDIPQFTELKSIYPNPFNPVAYIPFSLKDKADVSFKIYNSRGQIVRDWTLGEKVPGQYRISWDGTDYTGRALASGVYYIRMFAGKDSFQRKAVLQK